MTIRHTLRGLARTPGIAVVVVLSIGVGIGINTVVFSWIQAVVLRPLPGVTDVAALRLVEPRSDAGVYPGVSWPEYLDLVDRVPAFSDLVAYRMAPASAGDGADTERAYALLVSGNYFGALGLAPATGRLLTAADVSRAGDAPVVVISHDYWQTRFGGDSSAIGRDLRVNGTPLTIAGVTPEGFQGTVIGLQFDFWIPATMAPVILPGSRELEAREQRGYSIVGRLATGLTASRAEAEVSAAYADFARAYPEAAAATMAEVLPLWQSPRGPQRMFAAGLALLQALMLLVWAGVCGNLATLMLARASARHREAGIRMALGADRGAVARLILSESLALSAAGALVGMLIAWWGANALRAMPAYGALPVRFQTELDVTGLLVAAGLGVSAGLLIGVGPAWRLARLDAQEALRVGAASAGRSRGRAALMGVQVALALVVLMAAGFFFRNFASARTTDPGFDAAGVLLATYDLGPRLAGPDDATPRVREFARRLVERLAGAPGVENVAIASAVPLDIHGLPLRAFAIEGRPSDERAPDRALTLTVTPGYFDVMGTPLVAGAGFAPLDDAEMPPQVVVNETFVRRFVAGEPLGRRLTAWGGDYTIAGVVRDSTYEAFGEPSKPVVFYSYRDVPVALGEIHLRARPGVATTFASEVRLALQTLDSSLPLYNVRTMEAHIETNTVLRAIPARLFSVAAPLLLALVAIGIYAVVAYSVARRTSEIGVRLAVGATPGGVVGLIVRQAFMPIGAGAAVAWTVALGVDLHLFRMGFENWPVLAGAPAVLLTVALVAAWLPARRAARIDPLRALRQE